MTRALSAVILLSLAGCAVDQAAEVSQYRALIEAGPLPDRGPSQPLTLAEALLLANHFNETLSIEGERYLQALIERRRRAAALLPTLDLFGSLTFREQAGRSSPDSSSNNSETLLFDGGLRAQYSLLTGLTDFRAAQSADLTIEQRHYLLLDAREVLLLETARAYYAVLIAERLIQVLESSLAVQEERLRDIRGRHHVGFARPLDVAQIEAQASDTRVALLDARNDADRARAALSFLTGLETADLPLTDGFDPAETTPSLDDLERLALDMRQDVAAAAARAAAARVDVDAAIGQYYPTIGVNLDFFLTRDSTPTDRDWTSLLTVNLPLFAAGRIDADVRAAWSRFREAVLNHSLLARQARRDVRIAHADLRATHARLAETAKQVAAAAEALRQAEAAFDVGLGTNLERVTAQDDLLAAQLRAAREEFNVKIAELALHRAAGTLFDRFLNPADPAPLPPRRPVPDSPFITKPD